MWRDCWSIAVAPIPPTLPRLSKLGYNPPMHKLQLRDVEQIVNLVAKAGDPSVGQAIPVRKRILLEGIAELIDSDIWMWSTAVISQEVTGDAMTTCMIDGGWKDEAEQVGVYQALTNPLVFPAQVPMVEAVRNNRYATFMRHDLLPDDPENEAVMTWGKTGFDSLLIAIYPLGGKEIYSSVGFHRRKGKPSFSQRDRAIVHLILGQVDWLHRHGTGTPEKGKVVQLPPRERQVLVLLLTGDAPREIAEKLGISEHTVGDYMKNLYKHFEVNSRGELQAFFSN
jgi:DNA-binding CsgD family transcriptional regulator